MVCFVFFVFVLDIPCCFFACLTDKISWETGCAQTKEGWEGVGNISYLGPVFVSDMKDDRAVYMYY